MSWLHRSFWMGPLLITGVLAIVSLLVSRTKLHHIYRRQFAETRRERLFLTSFGFFTAVVAVRGMTIAIHNDFGPFHNVIMEGRHIHHMVWGILLLLLVGYLWLLQIGTGSDSSARLPSRITSLLSSRIISLLYGVAAALTT